MSSSYRNPWALLLGASAVLGLPGTARAANWQVLPRLELGGTYNDNYRMVEGSTPKLQVYGPYADALLDLNLISPRGNLELVPHVHSTYYPSDTADQSTDEFLTLDGDYHWQRSELKGAALYSNEDVIISELLPATFAGVGLGQPVIGEYGRVNVRNRRQLEQAAPEYTYDLTQRAHLDLPARYTRARYSQTQPQQIGWENYSGRLGMLFDMSTRSVVSVTGVVGRFQPQLGGHDTNRYGVNLEWDRQRSQTMHTYLRLGVDHIRANTTLGPVSSTGLTGGAGAVWHSQITEVVVDVLRNYSPSSAGAEVVSDELRLRAVHAFEPRFSGYFAARAVRMRGASSRQGLRIQGEDYLTGEVGVQYQLTMKTRLVAAYDYTWQRFQGDPTADSNAVTLSFIYQPLNEYQPLPEFTGIPQQEP